MLQGFVNYLLLFLVYTGVLAFRQGNENLVQILKAKWWKYLLLGLIDVEANYMIVKAYQYTTLTSVQLLDCFVIPVVMLLSWFILHSRYKAIHFAAVLMCLLGVGIMVCVDVLAVKDPGIGINKLLGDLLVLGGAILYGISNVSEEFIVKNFSREEFLGMLGLFATIFSGIQLGILEHNEIANINWNWQIDPTFVFWAVSPFLLRPTIGPTPGAVSLHRTYHPSPWIGLTITGAGRLRRLRERLRLALGSGRVDSDIGSSGSGSVFAHPGSRGLGRGHFTVRRGLGWPRDISLLGGGFNCREPRPPRRATTAAATATACSPAPDRTYHQRSRPSSEAAGAAATRRALGLARCGPSGAACNHNNLAAGEDSRRRERHCGLPSQ
ncbi:solute carrier family 35 member F2-like isoform X3 [Rhinoraja longicauda]